MRSDAQQGEFFSLTNFGSGLIYSGGETLLLKPYFRHPTYTPNQSVVAFYGTAHYHLCLLESYLDLPGLIPEVARRGPSNGPACFSNTVPATRYGAFGD